MSVFFDAPARLVYTTSRKSQTQEAVGAAGHLTAEKGEKTLFSIRRARVASVSCLQRRPSRKSPDSRNCCLCGQGRERSTCFLKW